MLERPEDILLASPEICMHLPRQQRVLGDVRLTGIPVQR